MGTQDSSQSFDDSGVNEETSYKSVLQRFFKDVSGKVCTIVGSAPHRYLNEDLQKNYLISVNGSIGALSRSPDLAVMFAGIVKAADETSIESRKILEGKKSSKTLYIHTGIAPGYKEAFEELGYDAGDSSGLTAEQRAGFITEATGIVLTGAAGKHVCSNGILAILLAVVFGAKEVNICGFSLDSGHYYIHNHTPRNHVDIDEKILSWLSRNANIICDNPILSDKFGFKLLPEVEEILSNYSQLDNLDVSRFSHFEYQAIINVCDFSQVILEYGIRLTPFLDTQLRNNKIYVVESDCDQASSLREKNANRDNISAIEVLHLNVNPSEDLGWKKYYRYISKVWTEKSFVHPDVVVVNEGFPVACFIYTCIRIQRPVTLIFADYFKKKSYRIVEKYFKPSHIVGKIAIFRLTPSPNENELMEDFIEALGIECGLEHQAYRSLKASADNVVLGIEKNQHLITNVATRQMKLESDVESLTKGVTPLHEEVVALTRLVSDIADSEKRQSEKLSAYARQLESKLSEIRRKYDSDTRDQSKRIRCLEKTNQNLRNHIKTLIDVLHSAAQWQNRGWYTRAFHKWRVPTKVEKIKNGLTAEK